MKKYNRKGHKGQIFSSILIANSAKNLAHFAVK